MDVFLIVYFECSFGDRLMLQRAYEFDSDHRCTGPAFIFHHYGQWALPGHLDWGGPGLLQSVELSRDRVVIHLNDAVARHPRGVRGFEIEFSLSDMHFDELQTAMRRCFCGVMEPVFAERIRNQPGHRP